MCQSGPERKNMPRGIFVFQKSSVLPTTVTGTPKYFAYAAVAIPYGPAPMTKSAVRFVFTPSDPLCYVVLSVARPLRPPCFNSRFRGSPAGIGRVTGAIDIDDHRCVIRR